jgi:hypothetical protein
MRQESVKTGQMWYEVVEDLARRATFGSCRVRGRGRQDRPGRARQSQEGVVQGVAGREERDREML